MCSFKGRGEIGNSLFVEPPQVYEDRIMMTRFNHSRGSNGLGSLRHGPVRRTYVPARCG